MSSTSIDPGDVLSWVTPINTLLLVIGLFVRAAPPRSSVKEGTWFSIMVCFTLVYGRTAFRAITDSGPSWIGVAVHIATMVVLAVNVAYITCDKIDLWERRKEADKNLVPRRRMGERRAPGSPERDW